jgi:Protein of unknown function (DUF3800)
MTYIIYCDESDGRGRYYSDFYGGALIQADLRESLEEVLNSSKGKSTGEMKWTAIGPHNEADYIDFVDTIFELMKEGFLKLRIMFTQNINQIEKGTYVKEERFFKLYYQFVKHAFGLRYSNPSSLKNIDVILYLDDVPDTKEKFSKFKDYMSSLSDFPVLKAARVRIRRDDIAEINSKNHIILQAVDVILGSIQFRLNDKHKEIQPGNRKRGKRTRAKERVYKHINRRIRELYPNFNIGGSTGQSDGPHVRWTHPYRHWCFVPTQSKRDLSRGKRPKKEAP